MTDMPLTLKELFFETTAICNRMASISKKSIDQNAFNTDQANDIETKFYAICYHFLIRTCDEIQKGEIKTAYMLLDYMDSCTKEIGIHQIFLAAIASMHDK